jgi:hypothetical protein
VHFEADDGLIFGEDVRGEGGCGHREILARRPKSKP